MHSNPKPYDRFITPSLIIIHLNFTINQINISELVVNSGKKFVSNMSKQCLSLCWSQPSSTANPSTTENSTTQAASLILEHVLTLHQIPVLCVPTASTATRTSKTPITPGLLKDQRAIMFNELYSTNALSFIGFATSSSALSNCGIFLFSEST